MNKKLLTLIVIVIVILAGGIIYWNQYKKRLLDGGVSNLILKKTDGLYHISADSVILDEIGGFLKVTDLRLKADTTIYDTITLSQNQPSVLANILIPRLVISGVKTPKALLTQELEGGSVLIDSPVIELLFTGSDVDTVKQMSYENAYRQILSGLRRIKVDTVSIRNATLLTRDLRGKNHQHQLDSLTINLFDIQIDSIANSDSTRFLFAREMQLHTREVKILSGNELYRYVIKNVEINTFSRLLFIGQFSINPLLAEGAFLRKFKFQQDRFDFDMYNIELTNLNIPKFLMEEVEADEMNIKKGSFKIYRDMQYPRSSASKVGNYPHQMLNKLPFAVFIRKAFFTDCFIEYKERAEATGETGRVQFHKASATIDYLTNQPHRLPASGIMTLDFNASFLNKAPLHAVLSFYNASKNGQWAARGKLGSMNATGVNELTEPMGLAKVEEGTIQSLHFDLTGNDYRADGKVTLLYSDLKVSLLKKEEDEKQKRKFISWVANMKLKSNNPNREGQEPRSAQVHYKRDTTRSFFALVWKTIFTGIKECAGF